jgi:hypothetical protein
MLSIILGVYPDMQLLGHVIILIFPSDLINSLCFYVLDQVAPLGDREPLPVLSLASAFYVPWTQAPASLSPSASAKPL